MTEPVNKKTGTYYRKERARKEELEKHLVKKMKPLQSFFKASTTNSNDDQPKQILSMNDELETNSCPSDTIQVDENGNSKEVQSNRPDDVQQCLPNSNENFFVKNVEEAFELDDDPSNWNVNHLEFVQNFLRNRVEQNVKRFNFGNSKREYTDQSRYCRSNFFFQKRINGEDIQRTWIYYSQSLGKMFCIYCKLYSQKQTGPFICDGFNDWKHYMKIEDHEKTRAHRSAAFKFAKGLVDAGRVISGLEKQIMDDRNYWINILKRIISVIKFISARGLPFRGSNENVGNNENGNYLGILELLAEYDPLLRQHIERYANKGKGTVSYLSSTITDELITILAEEVREIIIKEILLSKYFSLIVDSTPDVAHIDQLTICVRYVNDKGRAVERFLVFLANAGHKGIEMEIAVLDFLVSSGITIIDCRGQSYDNAKNMSGIYKGLQAKIKQLCPLAEYVPCSPHSLNLTLKHAVENNADIARFFLFVQNIYVFFSASTKRWAILLWHLKNDLIERQKHNPQERLLVPKSLSVTRWSARHDACRALKFGYKSFVSALKEIFENPEEKKIAQIEAEALYNDFFKIETAILLEYWTTILQRANVTSKSLQKPAIDIETSTYLYKSLSTYMANLRSEELFTIFEEKAKTLISSCPEWEEKNPRLDYNCYGKRVPKRNTRYDIGKSRDTVLSDSEKYRISIFYSSLDSMTSELASQVEAYETVLMPFSFLFKLEKLSNAEIRQGSDNLKSIYITDLDEDLEDECKQFTFFMKDINADIEKDQRQNTVDLNVNGDEDDTMVGETSGGKSRLISKPARMLQYIRQHKLEFTFPNLDVALRIFECIAVANATGERSFSGLKRVKNPLRSVLGDEKMNDLSLIFINNDLLEEIDIDVVINKFIESKERKRL